MSLPQWASQLGFTPDLWDASMCHVSDTKCWVWRLDNFPGYTVFRVPNSIAPDVVKLVEDRLPKPPKKGEGAEIASMLLAGLGVVEAAQLLSQWAESGKPVSEYEMVAGAMNAHVRLFKLDGAWDKSMERARKWIAQVRGEEEVTA